MFYNIVFAVALLVGGVSLYEIVHIGMQTYAENAPLKVDWHLEKQDRMNYLVKYCPNGDEIKNLNDQLKRAQNGDYDSENTSKEKNVEQQIKDLNEIRKLIIIEDKKCVYSRRTKEITRDMAMLDYAGAMYFDKYNSIDRILLSKDAYKSYCFVKHKSLLVLNNLMKHSSLPIIRNRAKKMKRIILKKDKSIFLERM